MISVKYKKDVIGSTYYPSNKNIVVGFSGFFVETLIFITGSISYTCENIYLCHSSVCTIKTCSSSLGTILKNFKNF